MFSLNYLFKSSDVIFNFDIGTGRVGKNFSNMKWLGQKSFQLSCPANRNLVFIRQFINSQDCDDILQFRIFLQDYLHLTGNLVMIIPDIGRIQNPGSRIKRVHRRINTFFNQFAGKYHGAVKVGKGGGRCRVRQVVCRHVDALNGRN